MQDNRKLVVNHSLTGSELTRSPGDTRWSIGVRNWTGYLQQPTIAAGLNKHCSRINPDIFDRIRKNSNAVEVAHHRANSTGKRCTLLQAVLK
jgi:hypothetical protein